MAIAKVREHEYNDIGRCVHCGAATWEQVVEWLKARNHKVPDTDERLWRWREKPAPPRIRMRPPAHEDAAVISVRLVELRAESELASVTRWCAGKQGRAKSECSQCTEYEACKICAIKKGRPTAECTLCFRPGQVSLPCPT